MKNSLRGTGRTTKMLKAALKASWEHKVAIVVYHWSEIYYVKFLLRKITLNGIPKNIRILDQDDIIGLQGWIGAIFIDHNAVRCMRAESLDRLFVLRHLCKTRTARVIV
jgi:hypothetical protein